ncbi:MAG: tRNA pseudouridine(38-40) synthase TruA [Burkholderiales bacterium]|nr:tRNA pseudouridine(38-40) synthase TruA [Opitutaceae bacterium]
MTDESPAPQRWKCLVAYDGTTFSGWQAQPDKNAVQDHIERRLATLLQAPVRIHGSGRTDAGVHSRGQVFHFDANWRHGAEKLLAALRGGLPPSIQVRTAETVTDAFHARFSATGKIYHYRLVHGEWADPFEHAFAWSVPKRLEVAAMRAAAEVLRGRHDFRAFSAFGGEERENTVRTLARLDLIEDGARLRIEAEAEGFLYKMVRSLVGALAYAGMGKLSPARIAELLAQRERTGEVETAPPQGLYLMKVHYPAPWGERL